MSIKEEIEIDLFIIGGGINGCAIARDAAGRGLSVYLCEQFDLASQTSSRSSKMIHGGLRYLEYNEFRLVRESLAERDVMLNIAPHIVEPLELIIPHNELQRPAWLIRLGLFLYDHLGFHLFRKSKINKSSRLPFKKKSPYFSPLQSNLKKAFSYYDCKVDDARLVILNAMDARRHGAIIETHTQLLSAHRHENHWICKIKNLKNEEKTIMAKAIINAAGPWVSTTLHERLAIPSQHQLELVQGSHIVIPKFYEGSHAYLLQNIDKRVIFVIPYHEKFTMIGTTDIVYQGAPEKVAVLEKEREYLCDVVNRYFKKCISPQDIVNEWSGVRPLLADESNNPSAVTRDYTLEIETDEHKALPILSIFGGKITTARKLAEHAIHEISLYFPAMKKDDWTQEQILPGGNIPKGNLQKYTKHLSRQYAFLPETLLHRYVHTYGTLTELLLSNIHQLDDMGKNYGHDLYQQEINYLKKYEWAQTMDDILWRRTKLGLLFK